MSEATTHSVRERLVQRIRGRLERLGAPRTQMSLIVLATAAVGFLASAGLLSLGFRVIWSRYVAAVAVAYAAFLFFVRLWLWMSEDDLHSDLDPGDVADVADVALDVSDAVGPASGAADGGLVPDADGCLPVAAVAVVVALAGAAAYVVATAPTFFAEVLLDGALSVGLYRRVKTLHRRHWLASSFRHTWFVFAGAALLLGALGWAMAHYVPGADSIGDIWGDARGVR